MSKHKKISEFIRTSQNKDANILIRTLLKKFYPERLQDRTYKMSDLGAMETLVEGVFYTENDTHDTHTPSMLVEIAKIICDLADIVDLGRGGWEHSLSHVFGSNMFERSGFLKNQSFFPAAEILINKVVKRAIEAETKQLESGATEQRRLKDLNCTTRFTHDLYNYNLKKIYKNGITKQFAFKPDSLSNPIFLKWLNNRTQNQEHGKYATLDAQFCRSNTPQDFINNIIERPIYIKIDKMKEIAHFIHHSLGEHQGKLFISNYIKHNITEKEVKKLVDNCDIENLLQIIDDQITAEKNTNITKGVFVDVQGTLIQDGQLCAPIVKYLKYLKKLNIQTTVFSDGDQKALSQELQRLGFDPYFLPIRSKALYRGHNLEYLIDDTPDDYQSFNAKNWTNLSYFINDIKQNEDVFRFSNNGLIDPPPPPASNFLNTFE